MKKWTRLIRLKSFAWLAPTPQSLSPNNSCRIRAASLAGTICALALASPCWLAPQLDQCGLGPCAFAAELQDQPASQGAAEPPASERPTVEGPSQPGGEQMEPETEVVVYAALDREFSEPILKRFEAETGIRVLATYDVESTKTVGLTTRLLQEASHPQCDVFWNNEMLHTLRLARVGVLDTYVSPQAQHFPAAYRSPAGHWHALAARARVIIYNKKQTPDPPTSIHALSDPQWKGRVGLAKPLFGSTATHFAVLYQRMGPESAQAFFDAVRQNVRVMSGNKQVAQAVAGGQLAWGMTDTDDAMVEIDAGRPVGIVFPDQPNTDENEDATDGAENKEKPWGAMFVPNSLGVIKGGPHPAAARRLVDFLLGAEVERQLALGPSAQFPMGQLAQDTPSRAAKFADSPTIQWFEPDFDAAAASWDEASAHLQERFTTGDAAELSPTGIVVTAFGGLLFICGLLSWAPQYLQDRQANRVLFTAIGLTVGMLGWWLAVRL